MKQRRYTVKVSPDNGFWLAEIADTRTGKLHEYAANAFIYGQTQYDKRTERFPNYVHAAIWRQIRVTNNG